MTDPLRLSHFIANRWELEHATDWTPTTNPSQSDDVIAQAPSATAADVEAAVTAAQEALSGWRALTGMARAEHLYRWAGAIEARHEELAQAMAREVGKPIGEARGEVARCWVILRYYAGEAVREIGSVIPAQFPGVVQFTVRQPHGVVALITPWNFPLAIPLWKAAPALAFGNTVVLKPSELSPHMAQLLAETAAAAELPPGVFNVLLGPGPAAGEPLLRHRGVRAVSFTGSVATGARVAVIASERNIPYQTEMGGKNVAIVMNDADLDQAAALTAAGAMRYAGQKCTATSRVVVEKGVADAFLTKLTDAVASLPLGPVTDPSCAVGPLIQEIARERILDAVAAASARPLYGGGTPEDAAYRSGHFYTPAVLGDVDPASPLARDELFGPVLATFTVSSLEEAIELANRTEYGLSAALFTHDIRNVLPYLDSIEAGMVRVNGDTTGVDPHAPFGGVKQSSSGSREQGPAAREFYTEIKTIQIGP